jgi:hypothetical protein
MRLRDPMLEPFELAAIFVSIFIVAGGPVIEELIRTLKWGHSSFSARTIEGERRPHGEK